MDKYLLIIVLFIVTATSTQGDTVCSSHLNSLYSKCQIDLTVAIDMSTAMGNIDNVDALVQSAQSLLAEFSYGSNTEASVLTWGALINHNVVNSTKYFNDFSSLCNYVEYAKTQSHLYGLFDVNLGNVLEYYKNSHFDEAYQQRVLVLLAANYNQTQVEDAWKTSDIIRNDEHVVIIVVVVGTMTSSYLPMIASQLFTSPSYNIGSTLIGEIANASCAYSENPYATYPPSAIVSTLSPSSTSLYVNGSSSPSANTSRIPTVPLPTTTTSSTLLPSLSPSSIPSSPYANGSDGLQCAANPKNAWLDLVVVIEHSDVTFLQWNAISSNVMSMISQFTLSNTLSSGHSSRIALITYDSAGTKLQFNFTAEQTARNLLIALNNAKPPPTVGDKADIAAGLQAASNYLTNNPSFRVPGVVLYAATYDDSGINDPKTAAEELKEDLIKIVTVSFDAANGVSTPKICTLASPGLCLDTHASLPQFGWTVSQLNCRCPHDWTQLVVNNVTYADCFFYQDTIALQAFSLCPAGTDILALASTPARVDLINQLVSKEDPTNAISVGLIRTDSTSKWTWESEYSWSGYPPFAQEVRDSDVYGYLSKSDDNNWQLFADDGLTTGRYYVCQRQSGDTDNIIDLEAN